MKNDTSEVRIIRMRMTKIQMMSWPQNSGLAARASARKAISATPVTP